MSIRGVSILSLGPAARAQVADKLLAEQRPAAAPVAKRHKYGAEPVVVDGVRFASKGEYERWCELLLLEKAGRISHLSRQPVFKLIINERAVLIRSEGFPNGRVAIYRADFAYREKGALIIEDFKGMDTDASRLRRAVVEAIYGFQIRVTGKGRAA